MRSKNPTARPEMVHDMCLALMKREDISRLKTHGDTPLEFPISSARQVNACEVRNDPSRQFSFSVRSGIYRRKWIGC